MVKCNVIHKLIFFPYLIYGPVYLIVVVEWPHLFILCKCKQAGITAAGSTYEPLSNLELPQQSEDKHKNMKLAENVFLEKLKKAHIVTLLKNIIS